MPAKEREGGEQEKKGGGWTSGTFSPDDSHDALVGGTRHVDAVNLDDEVPCPQAAELGRGGGVNLADEHRTGPSDAEAEAALAARYRDLEANGVQQFFSKFFFSRQKQQLYVTN